MTYEGRLELLAAAVIGAALGIVTGYVLGKPCWPYLSGHSLVHSLSLG
jgi:hypothetical protein